MLCVYVKGSRYNMVNCTQLNKVSIKNVKAKEGLANQMILNVPKFKSKKLLQCIFVCFKFRNYLFVLNRLVNAFRNSLI